MSAAVSAPWPEIRRVRAALRLSLREANAVLIRYGSAAAAISAILDTGDRASFEAAERVRMAAPDLLAALKRCVAICAGETMSKSELVAALELASAAIAKATGRPVTLP